MIFFYISILKTHNHISSCQIDIEGKVIYANNEDESPCGSCTRIPSAQKETLSEHMQKKEKNNDRQDSELQFEMSRVCRKFPFSKAQFLVFNCQLMVLFGSSLAAKSANIVRLSMFRHRELSYDLVLSGSQISGPMWPAPFTLTLFNTARITTLQSRFLFLKGRGIRSHPILIFYKVQQWQLCVRVCLCMRVCV